LKAAPSLKTVLRDRAAQETGLDEATFLDACPWDMAAEVLKDGWLPS
jgi:hypothetical protein